MEGILLFILYFLVFFYLFKFAFRLLKPWLLAYISKKIGEKLENGFTQDYKKTNPDRSNTSNSTFEGKSDVVNRKSSKKATKKVGEYIDFEEID